jgi:branched-subunit amino acid transport protein
MTGLWIGLVFSAAATYCWRVLGIAAARRLLLDGSLLLWVRAVTTALIAALVARFVYAPAGLLADTALLSRGAALGAAVIGYYLSGRRIEGGVASGAGLFILLEIAKS